MVQRMTSWERLEAAARLEEVDFVQSYLGLRGETYRKPPLVDSLKRWPEAVHFSTLPGQPGVEDFGARLDERSGGVESDWYSTAPIIRSVDDYDKVEVPDIRQLRTPMLEGWWSRHGRGQDKGLSERYGFMKACSVFGPIDFASELRGYDNLLADFLRYPREVHRLLDAITRVNVEWVKLCMEFQDDVRLILLADHSPTFLSPRLFRLFGEPYWTREFAAAPRAAIRFWHNEGDATHNLEGLASLGVNVFHYGWIDEAEAKRRVGDRICLCGNIKSTSTMLTGSVKDVEEAARRVVDVVAPGGGCILSTSGGMAPKTPLGNVDEIYKTGLRYGTYPLLK